MNSNQNISALRATLFDALQKIKDGTMPLDQARAMNEVAKTIVDTAKVEVDYLRTTGGGESQFLDGTIGQDNLPGELPRGILSVTRHRLAG